MAAANDNQGLKIAVAALVMLVFILGVTNYFAFSSASQNLAKAEKAAKDATDSEGKARTALEQANYYRTRIGFGAIENDPDAVKEAEKKEFTKLNNDIQAIGTETVTAINEVAKAGESDPKLEELKGIGQGIVSAFVSEPNENKIYVKSLERLKDLLVNQSRLMRELSLDYRKLRSELASANSVNAVEVAKNVAARDKAVQERQDEIAKIKTELQSLYDSITNLQNSEKDKTNSLADLNNKITDLTTRADQYKRDAQKTIVDIKDKLALKETVLGKAIGNVTNVDYSRGEVHVSVNKSQGVRPTMKFTVFDADARGIPTDKPKGTIELISVGDPDRNEPDSVARIVETKDPIAPIRRYDQIYSPGVNNGNPERYALVGKIDINRDGKDDRVELIRLIEKSGGLIEYDLPPVGADRTPGRLAVERTFARLGEPVPPITGRASGRVSPLAKGYVIDDQISLSGDVRTSRDLNLTPEGVAYANEKSAATKEARANGVPPIPVERLLTQLGYTPPRGGGGAPGSVEMKNRGAMKQLLKPKANQPGTPRPGTTPPAQPDAAEPPK